MDNNNYIQPIDEYKFIRDDFTDEYCVYLIVNLKIICQLETLKQIIQESAKNCDCVSEYFTHETEGTNNKITKNNIIYVVTFANQQKLESYIEFIATLKEIEVESIFHNDKIIFGSKKYIKSISQERQDVDKIKDQLTNNKKNNYFKKLFDILK